MVWKKMKMEKLFFQLIYQTISQKKINKKQMSINYKNINEDVSVIKNVIKNKNKNLYDNKQIKGFYPEIICAQLLKNLKDFSEKYCNQLINKAIITK